MTDVAIHSWIQLGTFLIATFVFMWYMRKDSKDDYIRLDTKLEMWRKETKEDIRRTEELMQSMHKEIRDEMKDFHEAMKEIQLRVCSMEARGK